MRLNNENDPYLKFNGAHNFKLNRKVYEHLDKVKKESAWLELGYKVDKIDKYQKFGSFKIKNMHFYFTKLIYLDEIDIKAINSGKKIVHTIGDICFYRTIGFDYPDFIDISEDMKYAGEAKYFYDKTCNDYALKYINKAIEFNDTKEDYWYLFFQINVALGNTLAVPQLLEHYKFDIDNVVYSGLMWDYFIDSHRHELFKLRNKLFNYALENNVSFEHPAFTDRWEEINTSIKYSHEIHLLFVTMLMDLFVHKSKINPEFIKLRKEHFDLLEEKDKEYFKSLLDNERELFLQYLVKSSLILLPLFLTIGLLLQFFRLYNIFSDQKRNRFKEKMKKTQNDIFDNFNSHLQAA